MVFKLSLAKVLVLNQSLVLNEITLETSLKQIVIMTSFNLVTH